MKVLLVAVGVIAVLMGLLWIGQGSGIVHWPASSFMLDERPWIARGALLAAAGLIVLVVAARIRR